MKNLLSYTAKTSITLSALLYLLLLALVGYLMHANMDLAVWQIILACSIAILMPGLIIYAILRASRNNSSEDLNREDAVMNDVVIIKQGDYLNSKTDLGKWYLVTVISILAFPIIAKAIGWLAPTRQEDVVLITGFIIIGAFIIGIFISNRSKIRKP